VQRAPELQLKGRHGESKGFLNPVPHCRPVRPGILSASRLFRSGDTASREHKPEDENGAMDGRNDRRDDEMTRCVDNAKQTLTDERRSITRQNRSDSSPPFAATELVLLDQGPEKTPGESAPAATAPTWLRCHPRASFVVVLKSLRSEPARRAIGPIRFSVSR
jgi:hypothetical protein